MVSRAMEAFDNFRYKAFSCGIAIAFSFESVISAIIRILSNDTEGFVINAIFAALFAWFAYDARKQMNLARENFEITEKPSSDSDPQ